MTRLLRWSLLIVIAVAACKKQGVIKVAGESDLVVTDDELEKYVAWWHDYLVAANQNVVDMKTTMERVSPRYSLANTDQIVRDPDMLAMNERNRTRMQEVTDRMPVTGRKMDALAATVPGVATLEMKDDKVVYVPGRNEIALNAARQKYGDAFVDWVVARESTIAKILSQ